MRLKHIDQCGQNSYLLKQHICTVSSAIWKKNARMSFSKTIEIAWVWSASAIWSLWKTHECMFFQIAREIILLLINNIHEKLMQKQIRGHFQTRNTCEVNHLPPTPILMTQQLNTRFQLSALKMCFVLAFSKYFVLALYFLFWHCVSVRIENIFHVYY
jgi:hypothetical protein